MPARTGPGAKCSPPTRGSVVSPSERHLHTVVLPAHAGVSRPRDDNRRAARRAPRPRGGQSVTLSFDQHFGLCSPPTRGSVGRVRTDAKMVRVLPAHAGVSRRIDAGTRTGPGAPRPRGGQSGWAAARAGIATCSPPTRGSVVRGAGAVRPAAVLPAHAGVSRTSTRSSCYSPRAPRPRGGQSDRPVFAGGGDECSPPTRGSVATQRDASTRVCVLPAHHRAVLLATNGQFYCPPPGRSHWPLTVVLPAHAGVSRCTSGSVWSRSCAPRPRGGQSKKAPIGAF